VWRSAGASACAIRALVILLLTACAVSGAIQPAQATTGDPVVVVGIPGLSWRDVDPDTTPNLYELTADAAGAQLSVRSVYRVTCAIDGWLTIGAGRRAAAQRVQGVDETENQPALNNVCPAQPPVEPRGEGAQVEGWDSLVTYNEELTFNARLGQLAETAETNERCTAAYGAGAALAVADESGQVETYYPDATLATTANLESCDLSVVDLASIDLRAGNKLDRETQVAAADVRLGNLLSMIPDSASVLLVGLADSEPSARLQISSLSGPDSSLGYLTSTSTRLTGLILLTDVTPTLYDLLGVPPAADFVGAPVQSTAASGTVEARNADLINLDRKVDAYGDVAPAFFTVLVTLQLILYSLAAWVIRGQPRASSRRRHLLQVTGFLALTFAAMPIATFLANYVPWWTWYRPRVGLVLTCIVVALLIAGVSLLGRKIPGILGEVSIVAAITALVLAVDVVGEDYLQTASLMGYSPVIAGRLYGFGNVAFALFVTAGIFAAAFFSDGLVRSGRRRWAAALVIVIGLGCLLVDGLPALGSDFGGMLAIAPAFGVLALGVLDLRITWRRILALLALGLVTVTTVAFLDWLRPAAEQSHLGRFIQQVLDGELFDVLFRKLGNNLNILGSSFLGVLVPSALVFGVLVLMRAGTGRVAVLREGFERAPTLRPALTAWLVAMTIGFAVNDSGVAIPAVGIMFAIPALIVISTRVLELQEPHQRERSDDENTVTPAH